MLNISIGFIGWWATDLRDFFVCGWCGCEGGEVQAGVRVLGVTLSVQGSAD